MFENTREGFEKLLFHTDILMRRHALQKCVFGMEPTADYHKPLGEYLIGMDHMVVFVAGSAVRKNRELLDGRWDKNDTKDAANIADLVCQGKCLFYDHPSPGIGELRTLLSLKRRLKKEEHSLAVRIRNHLIAQYFPELDPYYTCGEEPAVVRWCIDPREVSTLSLQEFSRMVSSRNGGEKQRRRLGEIHAIAASSIGCSVTPGVSYEAGLLVDTVRKTKEMVRETDESIASVCSSFPEYPCLMSIPGFDPDVSAKVLGALGDPRRFENHRQVLKLAGLDLSGDRSGKRSDVPVVISKRGKADLRYAIYQAAMVASSKNPVFMKYFTDRMAGRQRERGIGKRIRVKMAAKMLVIAWTLMKRKEMFDPGCIK
ncbi:MAG: IS110 family transposase [Syntrophorhabdaceae bacterium]|nr:IS110 family transposase [Syntrophorhabdaceae bacterium]